MKTLLLSFILLLSGSQLSLADSGNEIVGEILHIRGQGLLVRGGENFKIQQKNAIRRNDRIKTGANSIIIVGFGPNLNSRMKIDQDSEIVVDWASSKREKPKNAFESTVDVIKGSLNVAFNKNKEKDNNLKVKTRYVTFGIRGTDFFVHSGLTDVAFLAVKSGKVSASQYSRKDKKDIDSDVVKDGTVILTHKLERYEEQSPDWYKDINWDMEDKKYHFHKAELREKMYMAYEKNIKDKGKPEESVNGIDDLMEELYNVNTTR